jgi:hypothetical protein
MNIQPAIPAIIAFVGIIVGWALKEFAESARGLAATRRERRQVVYVLIRLYYEMVRVEHILERLKDASNDWQVFESHRQRYAQQYGDRSEQFVMDIRSAIRTTAGTDPWLSLQLGGVLDGYLAFKDIKLHSVHGHGSDTYITLLSTLEVSFTVYVQDLRQVILWLSFRCGLTDWLITVWNFRKRDRTLLLSSEPFKALQSMLTEVLNKPNATPSV